MRRKRIAVLMASIDREYQQKFAYGLAAAGAEYGIDICIFNSQGHPNVEVATNDVGECMIYDLPGLSDFDGIISLPATAGSEARQKKMYDVLAQMKGKPHTQTDISLMMNHINSYSRVSLGNKCPYDVFRFLYGSDLLELLGCTTIPAQQVTLNKSVFRKGEQNDLPE